MEDKFNELFSLNVNDKVEKKKTGATELTYLSWAWAVEKFTKAYPDWDYEIMTFENNFGNTVPYMQDDATGYMVSTKITAGGKTKQMWLPVMDGANKAMKVEPYKYSTKYGDKTVEQCSMFDVNKTIMRCLVKNMAMFGLGLYIYAGEDLPDGEAPVEQPTKVASKPTPKKVQLKEENIVKFKDDIEQPLDDTADMFTALNDCTNIKEWVQLFNSNIEFIQSHTDLKEAFAEKRKELNSKK